MSGDQGRGGAHQHYYRSLKDHCERPGNAEGCQVDLCVTQAGDEGDQEWLLEGHHQPGQCQRSPEKEYPAVCEFPDYFHR